MGKRDRVHRFVNGLCHPSEASASESAFNTTCSVSKPRLTGPTDQANGASLPEDQSQDAAKDLWGLAFERLPLEDKEALSRIKSDSKLDILRHLQSAAVKKRTNCEDQGWEFELNGRKIILRDVAEKIVI